MGIICKVRRLGGGTPTSLARSVSCPRTRNGGVPLLVLELCKRGDVKSCLRKEGALPAKTTMAMCRDVAAAMAFFETALVVQRDLAARNVLLTADMVRKVADLA